MDCQQIPNWRKRRRALCCWAQLRRKRDNLKKNANATTKLADPMAQSAQTLQKNLEQSLLAPSPLLDDSFLLFGIPLRTPSEYYRFLEMPKRERMDLNAKKGQHFANNIRSVDWTQRKNAQIWQKKQRKASIKSSTDQSSDVSDQCICTCAFPSTSSAPSKCLKSTVFGRVSVQIRKSPGQQLGLGIAGGSDRPIPPTISYLRPGFVAHRCDQLQVGDRLISVNGVNVENLTHIQVLALLRNAGSDLMELRLEYTLESDEKQSSRHNATIWKKSVELELIDDESAEGTFGMTVRGGAFGPDPTKSRPLTVTAIRAGGSAHREGRLAVGDRLLAINGESVRECTLSAALNILRSAAKQSERLHLSIEYDVCLLPFLRRLAAPLLLKIDKIPGNDFGCKLRIASRNGGALRSVIVKDIVPASTADRCGAVQIGDELLAIDGISLEMVSGMAEAYQLMRSQSLTLRLELIPAKSRCNGPNGEKIVAVARQRKKSNMDPQRRSDMDPLRKSDMDPMRKSDMDPLRKSDMDPLRRSDMDPLRKSDMDPMRLNSSLLQLNALNGIGICGRGTNSLSHARQRRQPSLPPQLIRTQQRDKEKEPNILRTENNENGTKKLLQSLRRKSGGASGDLSVPFLRSAVPNQSNYSPNSFSDWTPSATFPRRSLITDHHNYSSLSLLHFFLQILSLNLKQAFCSKTQMFHLCFHYTGFLGIATVSSITAQLSPTLDSMGTMCHTESMELTLNQDGAHNWGSFGIMFGKRRIEGSDADGLIPMPLMVERIERGSPADKCGVLQPGDRILCINDWNTTDGTLEEAQPVLPPGPGTLFVVRLAKRGSSLGIVCRSEHKGAAKGEPLIISDIRMGSVAHRCGSIQTGDRIHSIDDIPLAACTVEESIRLLQRSAPIVKLCIAKGGGEEEQDLLDSSHSVVYSVELSRKGQPLGVTIASAGGILDPIVISRLMPGGLAERTGALHVGDRIMAINGESMDGKKIGQVTQLLQQCPDPLNIKLCRMMLSQDAPGQIGQLPPGHCPPGQTAIWRSVTEKGTSKGQMCRCCNGIEGASSYEESSSKIGTPLKSVDSAMDSMEDSPPDNKNAHGIARLAHLRPSTSNNFQQGDLVSDGWDSGLSSAAATDSQSGGHIQQQQLSGRTSMQERCCVCRNDQLLGCSASASTSPQCSSMSSTGAGGAKREEEKEDWVRILDALETVGEEQMLRKLEECILSGQASNYTPSGCTKKCHPSLNFPSVENGILSRRFPPNGVQKYCPQTMSPFLPSTSSAEHQQFTESPFLWDKMAKGNAGGANNGNSAAHSKVPMGTNDHNGRVESAICRHTASKALQRPQTPVFDHKRRIGLLYNNSYSLELPPPMPSPRPAAPTASPLLRHVNHNSDTNLDKAVAVSSIISTPNIVSSSTFSSIPLFHEHQRLRSLSVIPFIASATSSGKQKEDANDGVEEANVGEEEEEDQFDELSEVFSIQLCRCPHTKSFGFSVCDGISDGETEGRREQQQQKQGIYVRSVIKEGPADRNGRVRPGDRILQINGRSIQFLTCDLALPLLATDRVDLLLLRKRTTANNWERLN